MIKQIVKCLASIEEISDWILSVTNNNTREAFFVLEQLETTRATETTDYEVTVYRNLEKDGTPFMGSSTVMIPHKMTDNALTELLKSAVYSAGLVFNKPFELVTGEKKRSFREKRSSLDPLKTLDEIAKIFFAASTSNNKFNSLELFHNIQEVHILNSRGVNYTKTLNSIEVEAIPSYDGDKQKVEIYKYFCYKNVDIEQIKRDASNSLTEAEARYFAEILNNKEKIDIILRDDEVSNLVREVISTSSYESVYKGTALYKINDFIQKDPVGDRLSISLVPQSKSDGFDKDGVLLKPVKIVENGQLVQNFGNNQYAYYLGVKPTGIFRFTKVNTGTKSADSMKKTPYIEVLALSGLQVDIYNGYIGGEIRLANYFDGNKTIPITGFSFSGNLSVALQDIELSKEKYLSAMFEGPKFLKLKNMEVL